MGLPWTPQTGSLAVGEVGESFNLKSVVPNTGLEAGSAITATEVPGPMQKQPIDAFLKHRLEEEGLRRHRRSPQPLG